MPRPLLTLRMLAPGLLLLVVVARVAAAVAVAAPPPMWWARALVRTRDAPTRGAKDAWAAPRRPMSSLCLSQEAAAVSGEWAQS